MSNPAKEPLLQNKSPGFRVENLNKHPRKLYGHLR